MENFSKTAAAATFALAAIFGGDNVAQAQQGQEHRPCPHRTVEQLQENRELRRDFCERTFFGRWVNWNQTSFSSAHGSLDNVTNACFIACERQRVISEDGDGGGQASEPSNGNGNDTGDHGPDSAPGGGGGPAGSSSAGPSGGPA